MRDGIQKLVLLVFALIAAGVVVLYAMHRNRFPIALEVCEQNGRCFYSALYRDWESCILATDRRTLYCDETTDQIICHRRNDAIGRGRCVRQ